MTKLELIDAANEIFDKDILDKSDIERLREIQEDLELLSNDATIAAKFGELIAQAIIDPNVYNP